MNSANRLTSVSLGSIVPFSFRNRVRCCLAQPSNIASNTAGAGSRCTTFVAEHQVRRTRQIHHMSHVALNATSLNPLRCADHHSSPIRWPARAGTVGGPEMLLNAVHDMGPMLHQMQFVPVR